MDRDAAVTGLPGDRLFFYDGWGAICKSFFGLRRPAVFVSSTIQVLKDRLTDLSIHLKCEKGAGVMSLLTALYLSM
jgi:hypothetical protein